MQFPRSHTTLLMLATSLLGSALSFGMETGSNAGELYKSLSRSVFVIETLNAKGEEVALGSGVSVASDRVVTNRHVVEDGQSWRVRQGESAWPAHIVYLDPGHDLCQLKISGLDATPVDIRDSPTLTVGEHVYAIGAPEGLELSLSEGLISGLRKYEGASLIQTTAAISHGSSGGGLFDAQGRLIGITTFAVKDGESLNFALPGEWVQSLDNHPFSGEMKTEAEKDASQAMLLFQVASDAMESGDYQKALTTDQILAQLTPNDPGVWATMGELYLELKQPEPALQACQHAIRVGADSPHAWACLGDVYEDRGNFTAAEGALKKAIELDPNEPINWLGLGRVFAEEGKRLGVMDVYARLKELDHNLADTFYERFVRPMMEQQNP